VVTGAGASVTLTANRGPAFTVAGEFVSTTIGASGSLIVPPTARDSVTATGVVSTGPISIDATGFVNLGNNDLIANGGSLAGLHAAVAAWYNGGTLTTVGLGSTTFDPASTFTTFGVFGNSDNVGNPIYGTFDGLAVNAASVIVKYTWMGDTNIDGILDTADFNAVLNGVTNALTGWQNGDINYDGVVDTTDFGLLMTAMSNYTGPLGGGGTPAGAIPEPAALGLLGASALLLGRRRR
jgi:hypothetical protein